MVKKNNIPANDTVKAIGKLKELAGGSGHPYGWTQDSAFGGLPGFGHSACWWNLEDIYFQFIIGESQHVYIRFYYSRAMGYNIIGTEFPYRYAIWGANNGSWSWGIGASTPAYVCCETAYYKGLYPCGLLDYDVNYNGGTGAAWDPNDKSKIGTAIDGSWVDVGPLSDYLITTSDTSITGHAWLGGRGWYPEGETNPISPTPRYFQFTAEELPTYYFPGAINLVGAVERQIHFISSCCTLQNEQGGTFPWYTTIVDGEKLKFKVIPWRGYMFDSVIDENGNEYTPGSDGFITIDKVTKNYTFTVTCVEELKTSIVYNNTEQSLKFYYDNQDHSDEGELLGFPGTSIPWEKYASNIKTVDFSGFGRYNLESMENWFGSTNYPLVTEIKIRNSVPNMKNAFKGLINLKTFYFVDIDAGKINNIESTFENCVSLEKIYTNIDIDLSSLTSINTFRNCSNKLVGENGTTWSADYINADYAKLDKKDSPGYFSITPEELHKNIKKIKKIPKQKIHKLSSPNSPEDYIPCDNVGHGVYIMDGSYREVKNMFGAEDPTVDKGFIKHDSNYRKQLKG